MSGRNMSQRGEGKLGFVIWTLVLILAVTIAVKMVPVRVKVADLEDYMIDVAQGDNRGSNEGLEKKLLNYARGLDLQVDRKNVEVRRSRSRIQMKMEFTVPVEFPFGYVYDWHFKLDVDRPVFNI